MLFVCCFPLPPFSAERSTLRADGIRTFLDAETRKTQRNCDIAKRAAERLYRNRGRVLHDAMVKAIDQAEQAHMKQVLRGILRALRLPMLSRRSITLLNRARMRNWCRICARYQYLWRAMPTYRRLRTMWNIWNKWLRFLDARFMRETPLLAEKVRRKRRLVCKLSGLLSQFGVDAHTADEAHVRAVQSTKQGIFFRWVELAQVNNTHRRMLAAAAARRDARVAQRAFHCWRSALPPRDTFAARRARPPFKEQRATYDLDKLKVRLLQFVHGQPTFHIRRVWRFRRRCVAARARAEPTLKRALSRQRELVHARAALEKQLLLQVASPRGFWLFFGGESRCKPVA